MLVLNGFFKDNAIIPEYPVSVPDGTRAVVSVQNTAPINREEINEQKKAWQEFFVELEAIDEPLLPEFDAVLDRPLCFNTVDFTWKTVSAAS